MSNSFFLKNLIPHLMNRAENAPSENRPNLPENASNLPPHPLVLESSRPEKKKRMIREWQDKIKEQSGAGKKGNRANKNLDPAQFDSTNWKCLSAAQAATAQYTGRFSLPSRMPKVEN
jgi:hypothetical protein